MPPVDPSEILLCMRPTPISPRIGFFQQLGNCGLLLDWQGPDSGNVLVSVPAGKLFSLA